MYELTLRYPLRKEYLGQNESIKNSRPFYSLDILLVHVQLSSLYWRQSSGDFPNFVLHLQYLNNSTIYLYSAQR